MELLKERIRREGKVLPGNIIKVDGFLNHRVDTALMSQLADEFAKYFDVSNITMVLTAEASGIPLATVCAQKYGVPMVFAKKAKSDNIEGGLYQSEIFSYTYKKKVTLIVAQEWLGPNDRVLIIDDFMALPTVITYLFPEFNQVYLYTIAGKDIYLTTIILGVGVAIFITYINMKGAKTAAILQTVLTAIIAIAGIMLVVGSAVNGTGSNITSQMWESNAGSTVGSVFKVACMTPFLFIGFDVIPQAAEEINVPYKKNRWNYVIVDFPCSSMVFTDYLCSLLYYATERNCRRNGITKWTGFRKSD